MENIFDIFDVNEYTRIRLGNKSDGGYVIPLELIPSIDNCITMGVGNDISFETNLYEISKKNNKLINFEFYDHTVNGLPKNNIENSKFIKKRIGTDIKDQIDIDPNSILTGKKNILWKFDIEGGEFQFTDKISKQNLSNCLLIVSEIHWLHKNETQSINLLNFLYNDFVLFHLHGNNNSRQYVKLYGRNIPSVIECTLINKKLINKSHVTSHKFPLENIDFPCNPRFKDMILDWTQK